MEHYRLRKYRGPETWALVREAYLAGEPGPALAKRFDVGLANLRRKAIREGWTRRRHALATDARGVRRMAALGAIDPEAPPTPEAAFAAALTLASDAMMGGRAEEAARVLRNAGVLARLSGLNAPPPEPAPPPPPTPEQRAEAEAQRRRDEAEFEARVAAMAERIAHAMLSAEAVGAPAAWSREVYRFRARHFPELAAADYARAVNNGWAHQVWDEHGRLRPPEPSPGFDLRMWDQHERCCAGVRAREAGDDPSTSSG